MILVRRALENFVEVIDLTPNNIVVLKFDKTVFSSDKHVILCGAYVCPPDSPYYKQTHGAIASSISVVEQCLLDCAEKKLSNHFSCCVGTLMRGQGTLIIHYKTVRRTHMNLSSQIYVGTDSQRIK